MNSIKQKISKLSPAELDQLLDHLAAEENFLIDKEHHDYFKNDFLSSINGLDVFEKIDTTGVQPLSFPVKNNELFLRKDKVVQEIDCNKWKKTIKHTKEGYLKIKYEK